MTSAPAAALLKINLLKAPLNPLKTKSLKGSTVNPLKRPNLFKSSPLTSGSSSKPEDSNSKKRPLSTGVLQSFAGNLAEAPRVFL
ncbi:hypothetical protein M422DRAFT_277299 [Sphaerobolus stellatus SS14]|uniref:Uncharacterized protein n=1 Tax=Sphaerobolus stellatus (strain SS14) TaxID=990650 RepID=A0A0C9U047_SPHS4|nr:hypothetical protein M422DRAFT_277299 [Sphaerobolus stellatus SS14]